MPAPASCVRLMTYVIDDSPQTSHEMNDCGDGLKQCDATCVDSDGPTSKAIRAQRIKADAMKKIVTKALLSLIHI